jgi:uncharacterized protein YecT (DUF1311 family)
MGHYRPALVLAFVIVASAAISCSQTQSDLDEQSCGQARKADRAMNATYAKILREYANDQEFITKLKAAQRAWVAFRDAELEALYPKTDKQTDYGTVYPMCRCSEIQFLTEKRTKELKRWLDGTIEGDVCAGSLKIIEQNRPKTDGPKK